MFHEGTKEVLFSLDGTGMGSRRGGQSLQVVWRPVGEGIAFEVPPYILHRIACPFRASAREFGGIPREEETMQMAHRVEKGPGFLGAVGLEMIPQEDSGRFQLPAKMAEKFDHSFRVDIGIGMETEVEMDTVAGGSYAQRGNGGDLLATAGSLVQNRSDTAGRPTASDQRGHQHTGLVEKNEESLQAIGFFLMRGHSSWTQRWISASSRSLARRSGFWGLHPRERRRRPI